MPVAQCPHVSELLQYSLGQLSDPDSQVLEQHLGNCERCRAALADSSFDDDPLIHMLRAESTPHNYAEEQACLSLVQAVVERGPDSDDAEGDHPSPEIKQIRGEYRILEPLGEGGMGTVYKALHEKMGRIVAIKVIKATHLTGKRRRLAIPRFEQEMRAVATLNHQHVVGALDAGYDKSNEILYLVMEYVDGVDVAKILSLQDDKRLRASDACEIVRQTALGLEHADRHGLVHRDIKPANLMLHHDPQIGPNVKILDLGLARPQADDGVGLTEDGSFLGTLDYMAPEQVENSSDADIRADIFSLGATLFHLLTGETIYGTQPRARKAAAAVEASVTPIADLKPELSEPLVNLVYKMLAKDRELRPSTPRDAIEAIEPFCDGHDLASLLSASTTKNSMFGSTSDTGRSHGAELSLDTKVRRANNRRSPRHDRRRTKMTIALTLACLFVVAVVTIVVALRNQHGSIQVTAADKDVELEVLRGEDIVDTWSVVQEKDGLLRLAVGEYRLRVSAPNADRFRVTPSEVTIARGDRVQVRVVRIPPDNEHANGGPPASTPDDASWGEGPLSPGKIPTNASMIASWTWEPKSHLSGISAVAWSPTGKFLAFATDLGCVRVVRIEDDLSFTLVRICSSHAGRVRTLEFSPRGDRLLSGGNDGRLHINAPDGSIAHEIELESTINDVAWSRQGDRFATVQKLGFVHVWSSSGELLHAFSGDKYYTDSIAFSPTGDRLVTAGGDRTLHVWSSEGEHLGQFHGHQSAIRSLDWRAGVIATGGTDDATIRLWSSAGKLLRTIENEDRPVDFVAIHPDGGSLIAGGRDETLVVWGINGEKLHTVRAADSVTHAGWRPNGQSIAVGTNSSLALYSTSGKLLHQQKAQTTPRLITVVIAPNSGEIFTGDDLGQVFQWTPVEQKTETVVALKEPCHKLAASPHDDTLAIAATKKVFTWRTDEAKTLLEAEANVNHILWHPHKANTLGVAAGDSVQIFRDGEAEPQRLRHTTRVLRLAWRHDAAGLAAGMDKLAGVQLWSQDGEKQGQLGGLRDHVYALAYSPTENRLVAGTAYARMAIYTSPDMAGQLLVGHKETIHHVVWDSSGRQFASVAGDGTVRLWHRDGVEGPLLKHPGAIRVTWIDDNRRLVTLSMDGSVRVWSATDGSLRREIHGHTAGSSFAIAPSEEEPDEHKLVVTGGNSIRFLNLPDGRLEHVAMLRGEDNLVWFTPTGLTNPDHAAALHKTYFARLRNHAGQVGYLPFSKFQELISKN